MCVSVCVCVCVFQQVKEEEERVRTLKGDLTSLRQQHEGLQQRLEGFMADTLNQEATAAILRQKYTVAMEKVQQLQEQLQASEEEMCYSRKQVTASRPRISPTQTCRNTLQLAQIHSLYLMHVDAC